MGGNTVIILGCTACNGSYPLCMSLFAMIAGIGAMLTQLVASVITTFTEYNIYY